MDRLEDISNKVEQDIKKDRLAHVKIIGLRDKSEEFLITVLSILFPHYAKNNTFDDSTIHVEVERLLELLRFFLDRQDLRVTESRKIEIDFLNSGDPSVNPYVNSVFSIISMNSGEKSDCKLSG